MSIRFSVTVELFYDAAWNDITADVYQRDPIEITRGRSSQAGQVDPSTCLLTINNRSGKYSPRNPTSTLYGKIGRNTPIRVGVNGAELITNPGFETNTTGWFATGGTLARSTAQAHSGVASGLLTPDGATATAQAGSTASAAPAVTVGERYRASVWVFSPDGFDAVNVAISWLDSADSVLSTDTGAVTGVTASMWTRLTVSAIAPASAAKASPRVQMTGTPAATDTLHIDDLSFRLFDVRFVGEVVAWPQQWNKAESDVWVPLEAAGIMRRLGQGQAALQSAPRRYITAQTPVAYWPCDDGASAAFAEPAVGSRKLQKIRGTGIAVIGRDQLAPWLDTGITLGIVRGQVSMGSGAWAVDAAFRYDPDGVRFALQTEGFDSAGTLQDFELVVREAAGLELFADDGLTLLDSVAATDLFGDTEEFHVFRIAASQSGSDIAWSVAVDGTTRLSGTITTATLQPVSVVDARVNLGNQVTVGHVAVWGGGSTIASAGNVSNAIFGHIGETAGTRISRLCSEEGVTFTSTGTLSDTAGCGPQYPETFLAIVREAAEADMGILYEPRGSLGLHYRTRASLYNQAAGLTLDYAGTVFASAPDPVDDDRFTRNDVTVQRRDGSSHRQVDDDSVDEVGRYDEQVTVNLAGDGKFLEDQAGWRLHLGTVDEARFPLQHLNLAHPTFTGDATLTGDVAGLDVGDRVDLANLPDWVSFNDAPQLAQGFVERFDNYTRDIVVNATPESPWRVAEYESAAGSTVNKYDTGGSTLATGIDSDDTSLSVATGTGHPLWTDADAEDGFDIEVGGERMTVTDISGTTSPQTFTVTRSVNGVVKSHSSGAAVRLWQTPRYGL